MEANNIKIKDCFYCADKWHCFDRLFKERIIPCNEKERLINLERYRNWEEI